MKLHQIIAIVKGKKNATEKKITEIYHRLQKTEGFNGLNRTYKPLNEDGETFPDENKKVQTTVEEEINAFSSSLTELINLIGSQDLSNCVAKANVVVDGNIILNNVPATFLMFLEKQVVDIQTFIGKIPTLDPGENWKYDENSGFNRSEVSKTNKTKKVMKNHIIAEATDKHPAQVQTYTEDEKIGEWSTTKFSGAIPVATKNLYLARVQKLIDAIRIAREEANTVNVIEFKEGNEIFEYIFKK